MKRKETTVALTVLISLLLSVSAMGNEIDWPDWPDHGSSRHVTQHTPSTNQGQDTLNPLVQGIHFFQRYISVVDSPRCPMYPTCSAYALQALDKHGPILGSFITVDRLLHETNPLEHTHPLRGFDRERFYDPLSRNDFWLSE